MVSYVVEPCVRRRFLVVAWLKIESEKECHVIPKAALLSLLKFERELFSVGLTPVQNCSSWYGITYGFLFKSEKSMSTQRERTISPWTYAVVYDIGDDVMVG
jgi:hypothetical protein